MKFYQFILKNLYPSINHQQSVKVVANKYFTCYKLISFLYNILYIFILYNTNSGRRNNFK